MKRILFVAALAAVLCLGITGLRVALMQQMAAPESPAPTPQRVNEPERPPAARPAEFVATSAARHTLRATDAAMVWSHTLSAARD